jgi:hypothetical protein
VSCGVCLDSWPKYWTNLCLCLLIKFKHLQNVASGAAPPATLHCILSDGNKIMPLSSGYLQLSGVTERNRIFCDIIFFSYFIFSELDKCTQFHPL